MSTAILDGSALHDTTTTATLIHNITASLGVLGQYYNRNDDANNNNNNDNDIIVTSSSDVVSRVAASIGGGISNNNHHHNIFFNDNSSGSSGNHINNYNNSSLMGNASMEETNPRLVNGVVNLLLMLFNIGGNGLVLYIYHSLFRNTVFNLFVKALAGLDLLTAVTTMLIDVIMKMRNNHEDQLNTSAMCKLSHFQVYANSMTSGCVLTLIAYQRYRKICHPLQRGMQLRQAKILLVSIAACCLVISIPTLFLYGSRRIQVLVRSTVVHAIICRADQSYQDTPLNLIFYYVLMVAFCCVLSSICVLYCMVSRSIRKFEKRSSAILNPSSPIASSPRGGGEGGGGEGDTETADEDDQEDDPRYALRGAGGGGGGGIVGGGGGYRNSPATSRTIMTSPVHGRNPAVIHDPFHARRATPYSPYSVPNPNNTRGRGEGGGVGARGLGPGRPYPNANATPKKDSRASNHCNNGRKLSTFTMATTGNVISTQMYRVFSIITGVFIISYLPHLVALILTRVLDLDDKVLTHGQRIALEFAYNCPYISTVSNPIIYGFSSSEFRDRVREMLQSCDVFCCCCWCCCCACCCGDREDRACVCCDAFDCCESYACCNEDD